MGPETPDEGSYMRARDNFCGVGKDGREGAKLLEMVFSYFTKKMKDGKAKWQIVGDTLSGCSCGNLTSPRKSVPNFGVEIFGFYNKINLQEKEAE